MPAAPHETAFRAACDLPEATPAAAVVEPIARAVERARAAHPDLPLDLEAFAATLGASVAGSADPLAEVLALHHGELLLAHAAARGDTVAIARLERDHLSP